LAEKQASRKEIAGMRHEKLSAVTFMQQFYDARIAATFDRQLHFIHDSDSDPR
jgi:hypothetical protein